ncbi:MAG: hypothetical protein O3A91_07035, partial [Proteobacteria bacterium]|nr:hypothetical protein [Pseudomonadota bacterium]
PPDWQLDARAALQGFEKHYLEGNAKLAETEFARAREEIRRTGRGDLLARAELIRCAARTASLEIDSCPGFEALRRDAGAEELAYADYLAGKGKHTVTEDALSRLVAAGVAFRTTTVTPAQIAAAIDTASAQGWRRPLLGWLEVEAKRAEAAGDREAAERLRRRIAFATGTR